MAVDNGNSYKSGATALAAPVHTEPVGLAVEEKLTVLLNKDGGMENMEVQGSMSLQVCRLVPATLLQLTAHGGEKAQQIWWPGMSVCCFDDVTIAKLDRGLTLAT